MHSDNALKIHILLSQTKDQPQSRGTCSACKVINGYYYVSIKNINEQIQSEIIVHCL